MHKIFKSKFKSIILFMLLSFNVSSSILSHQTLINNTAEYTYNDGESNSEVKMSSNTVSISIGAVLNYELINKNLKVEKYKNETVTLFHQINNKSNKETNININISDDINSDFVLLNRIQFIDNNSNKIFDNGDVEIINNKVNEINFKIDQIKDIVIIGETPNTVSYGDVNNINIFTEIENEISFSTIDVISIIEDINFDIEADSNVTTSSQGQEVQFLFDTNNNLGINLVSTLIKVDNTEKDYIVISSQIPANSTYFNRVSGDEDLFAYHIIGYPDNSYVTIEPSDKSLIDKIAYLYENYEHKNKESGAYSVEINQNASKEISTSFNILYRDINNELVNDETNIIKVELPVLDVEYDNYSDNYKKEKEILMMNDVLNLQSLAAQCNISSSEIESFNLKISTKLSGDNEETLILKETESNSGVFRLSNVEVTNSNGLSPIENNGIIEVLNNDEIYSSFICNGKTISKTIYVSPVSTIFNSQTNEPISNVSISLKRIDEFGNKSTPVVYDLEGKEISNNQITDENGTFFFPSVDEGNYIIEIGGNKDYNFPSVEPISFFVNGRFINKEGSFGKAFASTPLKSTNIISLDIPLDPAKKSNLLLQKTADKETAETGDVVKYKIKLNNQSDQDIVDLKIIDILPLGLDFISHDEYEYSINNNTITFKIPSLIANNEIELSYKVLVKINATNGTGINTAQAFSENYTSNISKHKLEITQDSIFENPLIMGKVFKDCNRNSVKDFDEIGIPGVKIYLDNGFYAITDENGNYKFYNLKARTHAVRIDKSSLPKPYKFEIINNNNAKDPYSAFADLKFGELHRRDFRDTECSLESMNTVKNRVENLKNIKNEVEKSANKELDFSLNVEGDLKNKEDSGLIGERDDNIRKIYNGENNIILQDKNKIKEDNENRIIKNISSTIDLEDYIKNNLLEPSLDFIDLDDLDIISNNQVSIRFKNHIGKATKLFVNDEEISQKKISQETQNSKSSVSLSEYVAVPLKTGKNLLSLRIKDPWGNIRETKEISIFSVGSFKNIVVNLPDGNKIPANNEIPFPIVVNLTDENNLKVSGKHIVTLETTIGLWDVEDINEDEDGIQTIVDNGEAIFDFISPSIADKGQIKLTVNDVVMKEDIFATTYLRDMFAVGIIEGILNFGDEDLSDNISQTGLEDEISSFDMIDGAGARISLFLKGKVRGDYLLTLAYDSDKDSSDKLYNDIDPDEFYPIYGDSSINGFEAQSTSDIFVKIAKNNSFIMYGDFNTKDYDDKNIDLGNYNRTLTGLKQKYQRNKITLNYYISQETFGSRTVEFESSGGFGPYNFSNGEEVSENSEKVTIITKDKNTGVVIQETKMSRFTDYEINGFYDGIVFREPIPIVDSDFNPNFIRIDYETESDNEKYLIYGVKGSYAVTKDLSIGLNYNASNEEDNKFSITSTNINYEKDGLKANFEMAESNNQNIKGYGAKLNITYNETGKSIVLRAETANRDFDNKYTSVDGGKTVISLKTKNELFKKANIKNDVYYVKENETNKETKSLKTTIETVVTPSISVETGVRFNNNKLDNYESNATLLSSRITLQPDFLEKVSTYTEYEQSLDSSDVNRLEFGVEYAINEKGSIYLTQERLSNLVSEIEVSDEETKSVNTILGTNYDLTKDTQLYSEYRIDNAINEKDAEAAIGVRNSFELTEKLLGNLSIERVENISGSSSTTTNFAAGLQYSASKNLKTTYRLQYSNSDSSDFYLGSFGYIRKINNNYSILLKDTVAYEEADDTWQNKFLSGVAYRDNGLNELNMLFKYENEFLKENNLNDVTNKISIQANKQINKNLTVSGMYSLKHRKNSIENYSYIGNLLSSRISYDINEDYDLGVSTAYLFDNETVNNYIVGLEAGYLVKENIWISLGYNFEGLSDNKYSNENYYSKGFYLRFRAKLTEDDFKWLK